VATKTAFAPLTRLRALRALGPLLAGNRVDLDPATWRGLSALVNEHFLGPAVWASLGHNEPPGDVRTDLRTQYHRNLVRLVQIRAQLMEVLSALNEAGVSPAPLKGALHLLENTFRNPATRVLGDLDILVARPEADTAMSALEARGYRLQRRSPMEEHDAAMLPPTTGVLVELHSELATSPVTCILPTETYLRGCEVVERGSVHYLSASADHVVLHNVLHSQVEDRNHKVFGLPLRQLHTFVTFVLHRGRQVDWSEVIRVMETHGDLRVLAGYLDLAEAVFGLKPPVKLPSSPWRRRACLFNGVTGGRAADVARNLEFAFAADYLRERYGESPRARLWARHAWTLWSERGTATTFREATVSSRWR
jgi:hypothetical protein